jgi:hypothetical protein
MNEIRIIGSVLLLLFASYIAVMNWGCVIFSLRNKWKGIDKHHSTVPLISFIPSAVAYALYPLSPKEWIFIIPVADIGNWMLIIGLPWAIVKCAISKAPPNKKDVSNPSSLDR